MFLKHIRHCGGTAVASMMVGLLFISGGCGDATTETESVGHVPAPPAFIEGPAVALYVEGVGDSSDVQAQQLGCGVLASAFRRGQQRYFILTSAHVLEKARGMKAIQVGVLAKGDHSRIKRLHASPETIRWVMPDIARDVALGDITATIDAMEGFGTEVKCVDLDAIRFESTGLHRHLLPNLSVAVIDGYHRRGIGQFSSVTAICADPGDMQCLDPVSCEWTSPFVRKEGTYIHDLAKKSFKHKDGSNGKPRELQVVEIRGTVVEGNSGAPVYIRDREGRECFAGIVSGMEEEYFYMTPADYILDYVNEVYAEVPSDAKHSENLVTVSKKTFTAKACGEVCAPIMAWEPGVRKLTITLAGEATDDNALKLCIGKDLNQNGRIDAGSDEVDLQIGWDNINQRGCAPGLKNLSISFFTDDEGNLTGYNFGDREKFFLSEGAYAGGLIYSKDWNMLCVKASGTDPKGRITIELSKEEGETK